MSSLIVSLNVGRQVLWVWWYPFNPIRTANRVKRVNSTMADMLIIIVAHYRGCFVTIVVALYVCTINQDLPFSGV